MSSKSKQPTSVIQYLGNSSIIGTTIQEMYAVWLESQKRSGLPTREPCPITCQMIYVCRRILGELHYMLRGTPRQQPSRSPEFTPGATLHEQIWCMWVEGIFNNVISQCVPGRGAFPHSHDNPALFHNWINSCRRKEGFMELHPNQDLPLSSLSSLSL